MARRFDIRQVLIRIPRVAAVADCIDATGGCFAPDPERPDASVHMYTQRLLAGAPPRSDIAGADRGLRLTDLFPELAATPPDHPAHTRPADTHLVPWFTGDIEERIARTRNKLEREFPGIENPGNPLFDPMSEEQGEIEYRRLLGIYESIRDAGFRPARRRLEAIQGVVVRRRNGERRFLVMGGKHRVAALGALVAEARDTGASGGASSGTGSDPGGGGTARAVPSRIRVRLRQPGVVRQEDVDRWGLVQSGFWPRDAALAYFERLFTGRSCFDVSS